MAPLPDAWIALKARIALLTAEGLAAFAIHADALDGRVTLHGKVHTADERARAESVVAPLEGVRAVRNLLQVVPRPLEDLVEQADADLQARVEAALREQGESEVEVVSVHNGVVLLGGRVRSSEAHLRALRGAARVAGVRSLASEVRGPDPDEELRHMLEDLGAPEGARRFQERTSDAWITWTLRERLLADDRIPALDVNIDTEEGHVTLFGVVSSEAAKAAAVSQAQGVPGVRRVTSHLEVAVVGDPGLRERSDRELEQEARLALAEHLAAEGLPEGAVHAEAKNGMVRLKGFVPTPEAGLRLACRIRALPGVRTVQNDLRAESLLPLG